ncbi:MAG: PilZ domain-containing protein [Candidatus Omnitrophica bacterium]|nr:PilZ domain-containing protein [Candidatus Omnitrophota bacterium]MBI3021605.1 PilZ domain-containing protein [Candidatus Omnitrophota bacterium]MBI3083619.1 PilZ domain-containing protein [Candidatus Omnitrophota bacterium]
MEKERRKFPRSRQPFEARYRNYGALVDPWQPITLINLGAGGLCFQTESLLELGSRLEIELPLPTEERLILHGRLLWSRPQPHNVAEHGVEFTDVTQEQQIQLDALVDFLRGKRP